MTNLDDVRYRTARGGIVPLDRKQQRQLLELYAEHGRPVHEIADVFNLSTSTIYRILPLLGVRAQDAAR